MQILKRLNARRILPIYLICNLNGLGNTLDSMAGTWSQQMKFNLPGHLFTHLGCSERPYCLQSDIYSRLCWVNGLMILD